jgi:hypothetical protein
MGSSFEDLVERSPKAKMDYNSDTWFKSYDFLYFLLTKLNAQCVVFGCFP